MRVLLVALGCLAVVIAATTGTARSDEATDPTHIEVDPIRIDLGPGGKIETMAMDRDGNLLLGVSNRPGDINAGDINDRERVRGDASPGSRRRPFPGRPQPGNAEARDDNERVFAIKVVSRHGNVVAAWPLEGVSPHMLHACPDGTVYVCGHELLVKLDSRGKPHRRVAFADFLDGHFSHANASGITVCDDYVFIAFGQGFSLRSTEDIVRFDRDLGSAKLIVEQQFGCCSHIDLDVKDDVLLVAENSRHRVNRFTFEGDRLDTWGSRSRTSIEGFAACCNPVNFDFGPGGVLFTAESGVGRVKRYTADGAYLGMVGYVDTTKFDNGSALAAQSCYIPVEVAADGKRVYVMDVRANFIRVLAERE